ncbi:MAG: hypothetical protein RL291_420, partial [Pseudomonadota bacterium]
IRRIEDEIDREDMVPFDHERGAPRQFVDDPAQGSAPKPRRR